MGNYQAFLGLVRVPRAQVRFGEARGDWNQDLNRPCTLGEPFLAGLIPMNTAMQDTVPTHVCINEYVHDRTNIV